MKKTMVRPYLRVRNILKFHNDYIPDGTGKLNTMKNSGDKSKTAALLRQKAEELLKKKSSKSGLHLAETEVLQLIHELEVHQVELELQNEELILAKSSALVAAEKYAELYDFAPSGYCTLSKEGEIVELNLNGSTMLGKERSRLVNNRLGAFVSDGTKPVFNLFLERIFTSKTRESCEAILSTNDRPPMYVYLTGIVTGNGEQCYVTMVDITGHKRADEEHRKYEQQLQQTQKLESLGLLAGGIAHDFNNLMGGIFGYIDMAREESKDEKVRLYLSKTMNTIDRARGLTAQLLTFAKGGAPVQKVTSLFPFIQGAAQFALSGSNVSCLFDVAEHLWLCNIDKNQIGQAIENIIINAKQAMPAGGTIEVTARNISQGEQEQSTLAPGNYVKISIKDSGIGIAKELLPLIFDPFYTTKTKGHGLGLATCYSIIKRHGGAIAVESQPCKGSTFHIYLPASAEPVLETTASPVVKHKGSGTIIVMDDEEVMRDTIKHTLKTLGYSVICKNDGRETLESFIQETKAKRAITGLILDLTIPGGMGGKATVEEIRKLNTEIPVFVASGYADDPVMINPADYGFTASLGKPFIKNELEEMLERHLKKEI
jgi:signal transduction histidine kinase/ActR/RegA family two-component response regulator